MYNKKIKHKTIFIRIPRTGSGTIGKILGVEDSHKTARDMKKQYGSWWDEYFKFAFVRNPYTRFQSCYVATGQDLKMNINEFLLYPENFDEAMKLHAPFFRPQKDYVTDGRGSLMLDFVGRYEKLKDHIKYIKKEISLENDELPHLHKTDRPHQELTPASKDILYDIYQEDFEFFKYAK